MACGRQGRIEMERMLYFSVSFVRSVNNGHLKDVLLAQILGLADIGIKIL